MIYIKNKMSGLLTPEINEEIIGTAEVLDIFKVSKVGKVAGWKGFKWRDKSRLSC